MLKLLTFLKYSKLYIKIQNDFIFKKILKIQFKNLKIMQILNRTDFTLIKQDAL